MERFLSKVTDTLGRPAAVFVAAMLIVIWAPTILFIGDVDTWQLIINTMTTIVTFVMGFVIHNTQTRNDRALQTKQDAQIELQLAIAIFLGADEDPAIAPIMDKAGHLIGLEDEPAKDIRSRQNEIRSES